MEFVITVDSYIDYQVMFSMMNIFFSIWKIIQATLFAINFSHELNDIFTLL